MSTQVGILAFFFIGLSLGLVTISEDAARHRGQRAASIRQRNLGGAPAESGKLLAAPAHAESAWSSAARSARSEEPAARVQLRLLIGVEDGVEGRVGLILGGNDLPGESSDLRRQG